MRNSLQKLSFNLVKRYRHSTLSQWVILVIDMLLFFAAFILMEAFRGGGFAGLSLRDAVVKLIISFMVTVIFFFFTGTYKAIIRHAGLSDIYKILIATIGPAILYFIINIVNNQFRPPIISSRYLLTYRETVTVYMLWPSS